LLRKVNFMDEKILIQVDTFIQGQDTIDLTIECLKRARLLGFPILLTAHSEIPDHIQNLADFVEIDLCNPILGNTGGISYLNSFSSAIEISIRLDEPDPHAPACLTSIINGARFACENGFNFFLRIEYDSIIKLDFIERVKALLKIASGIDGAVFSNFGEWVDGKFIFCRSESYLKCFDTSIKSGEDYLRFINEQGVPEKDWRHLQAVQHHILYKNCVLQNMVILPTGFLENIIDKSFNKIRDKEIGIFRPAKVINGGGEKFATIAHGFSRSATFDFEIYLNGILENVEEQNFAEGQATYKIFPILPETLYKVVYTNPVTKQIEQWEFSSSDELYEIARITFK
jgi:hypothetical protein